MYACQASQYDWVYPHEKWMISRNHFMPVEVIRKEEERWQLEENQRKAFEKMEASGHSTNIPTISGDDDDNSIVAAVDMGNHVEIEVLKKSKCGETIFKAEIDNRIESDREYSTELQEVGLLGAASLNKISDVQTSTEANIHTVTIFDLQEQVIALRKELCQRALPNAIKSAVLEKKIYGGCSRLNGAWGMCGRMC